MLTSIILAVALTGEFCVEASCQPLTVEPGPAFVTVVDPSDRARPYTWASTDSSTAILGLIEPGESRVHIPSVGDDHSVLLRIMSREETPPPVVARLNGEDSEQLSWRVALSPLSGSHEVRIFSVPTISSVDLSSEGRTLQEHASDRDAGVFEWRLVPQIAGRAIDGKSGQEVPYFIVEEEGTIIGEGDSAGRVTIDHPYPDLPREIRFSAAGFGSQWVRISPGAQTLGLVEMHRGVTMTLRVDHPLALEPLPISVDIHRKSLDQQAQRVLFEGTGQTGEEMEIVGLPDGEHRLHISGPRPLQHFSEVVTISGVDIEKDVLLKPVSARGLVTYGRDVLPDAEVNVKSVDKWSGNVVTDADGAFEEELWSESDLALIVSAAPLKRPYFTMSKGTTLDPRFLDVHIPATRVVGWVHEREMAISNARVEIKSVFGETRYSQVAGSAEDGSFELTGVPEGKHELTVTADGYAGVELVVSTKASQDLYELDVPLVPGDVADIRVEEAWGAPVIQALVLAGASKDGIFPDRYSFTDENGRAQVSLESRDLNHVFVTDSGGNFTATIIPSTHEGEISMRMAATFGELRISVLDSGGNPVPNVRFAVKYNGYLIPWSTMEQLLDFRHVARSTDNAGNLVLPRLPAGSYELFPWSNEQDFLSIVSTHWFRPGPLALFLEAGLAVPVTVRLK